MSLSMDNLGDFMRVGQQAYPERVNSVQVIQRGPHGKRIAYDPVEVRRSKSSGSGIRFWDEGAFLKSRTSFTPTQKVVGLMGLGFLWPWEEEKRVRVDNPSVEPLYVCPPGAPRLPVFRADPTGGSVKEKDIRSFLTVLKSSALRACQGDQAAAKSDLLGAWNYFSRSLSEAEKASWFGEVAKTLAYIKSTEAKATEYAASYEKAASALAVKQKAFVASGGVEEAKRENEAELRKLRCLKGELSQCESGDFLPGLTEIPWAKIALGLGGALLVYGVASGFGQGLAARAKG